MQTFLPKITDYWDEQVQAVDKFAKAFALLPDNERIAGLQAIEQAVTEHVRVLPDNLLAKVLLAVSDDLYKAASWIDRWDVSLSTYINASAGTLMRLMRARGLILHYLIDNRFPEGMERPLQLFPEWFRAAGIVFVCPQTLAYQLMTSDLGDSPPFVENLARYIDEARAVAQQLVMECLKEQRHFVLLDADEDHGPMFDTPLELAGTEGILTVLRTEAPNPGTNVDCWFPGERAKS